MPITSSLEPTKKELEIKIQGRFDFSTHQEFRKSFQDVDAENYKFIVNLSNAEYMDSSALGMLLLLRERAGGDKANIRLQGCSQEILQILNVSNFGALFQIQ